MIGPSRRGEERVIINKEFSEFDSFLSEYVTNISRSGVFIRSKDPQPVGTELDLLFTVVVTDNIETVEGVGKVVRVEEEREPRGMGVVFLDLPSNSKTIIERLVSQ